MKAEDLKIAAQELVNWLNGNGLTNKSRRNRVPIKLLLSLENALYRFDEADTHPSLPSKTAVIDPSRYPLIPMSEITNEARKIAVAWMECDDKNWIGQKHKLASDIMNYAKIFALSNMRDEVKERNDDLRKRLTDGRHYLMGVEPKDLTVEDALDAFGLGRNGLNAF